MGAGEIEKEGAMEGQRGVSRKLRVLGFETAEGTGCTPLWRIQHSDALKQNFWLAVHILSHLALCL